MRTEVIKNKVLTVLFCLAVFILLLTFSIGLPIYFRPFYYLQIEPLGIPEDTGKTVAEIREAYDEVLNYLTLPGREFGTGVFKFSEDGAGHFADCKVLFDLNAWAFVISLVSVVVLLVLDRCGKIKLQKMGGFPPTFYSGVTSLTLFALLGVLVSLDFDRAFVIFHALFFPGKDNWLFNPRTDEIINAMPQTFFLNCAILIASSVILISLGLLVRGIIMKLRSKKI